jgi:hypothetical protein
MCVVKNGKKLAIEAIPHGVVENVIIRTLKLGERNGQSTLQLLFYVR